jgi:methionyl-tRNA formyltransferase
MNRIMRILFLGNNRIAWQLAGWLRDQGDDIVGVILHPPDRRRFGDEIISAAAVDATRIFDGSRLREPETLATIRALRPEIGISVLFGYLLRQEFLDLLPAGCLNVHPSLLPYNRGAYPNVWSIVERTPAGVTLHYIDAGVDTGDIVSQKEVPVDAVDTGASLYRKLEQAGVELFQATWPLVRIGQATRLPQQPGEGTYHRVADVATIDEIDLDSTYTARELIDRIRARTFPPYRGTYIVVGGRRIYLGLELVDEADVESNQYGTVS